MEETLFLYQHGTPFHWIDDKTCIVFICSMLEKMVLAEKPSIGFWNVITFVLKGNWIAIW